MRIIYLDLDGMVANLEKRLIELHNRCYGTQYTQADIQYDGNAEAHLRTDEGALAPLHELLYEDGIFGDLEPLPGAAQAIQDLREIGELFILTAPSRNPDSASDKIRWANGHFGIDRREVILAKRKHLLRGDVLLDDWPEQLVNFRRENPNAFLGSIAYPYNRSLTDVVDVIAEDHRNTEAAWKTLVAAVDKYFSERSF